MDTFIPRKRLLMGPGPSDIHPRVLEAQSRPTIGHLDPQFIELMDEVKQLLQEAFKTKNDMTFPISAPGSAGMEACFVNLLEKGDTVIICENGVFGQRMAENARRCGANVLLLQQPWGQQVSLADLEKLLKSNPQSCAVAFVHAETSTGVRSDAQAISSLAKKYGCLTIADAVSSLGGIDLQVDQWQLDAVYSGTQKCLSAPPGLSPITFSTMALEKIRTRKTPVQSWFLDVNLLMGYWGQGTQTKRAYHHTAPVNAIYGLHESLRMLLEEGLPESFQRHREVHKVLRDGLQRRGFEFLVEEEYRLPQLNAVKIPHGFNDIVIRQTLLDHYDIEIGAGLGPLSGEIWRIGLMGTSCTRKNVDFFLRSLDSILHEEPLATTRSS